jgi:hypothetical protein
MRGLAGLLYFALCGYLFAKYDGDKIVAEALHKAFRGLVIEAAEIRRELDPQPAVVLDLTSIGMPGWQITPRQDTPEQWWEAQHG